MAAKRPTRPSTIQQLTTGTLINDDAKAMSRLLSELGDAHNALANRVQTRSSVTADLAVGVNRVQHGLGRTPRGATVTPTVADATWAWAMTGADERTIAITCVGVPQPNAEIEVH